MPRKVTRRLTLWVDKDLVGESADELLLMYKDMAEKHNDTVNRSRYPDSGFDVLTPSAEGCLEPAGYVVNGSHTQLKLKTGVRCVMDRFDPDDSDSMGWPEAFYLFPRSSISKTYCRLANNVGIIDSGYRGQLIAVFDILQNGPLPKDIREHAKPYTRLVQICCGDLRPFIVDVKMADGNDVENLISSTARGEGGFGSTGL